MICSHVFTHYFGPKVVIALTNHDSDERYAHGAELLPLFGLKKAKPDTHYSCFAPSLCSSSTRSASDYSKQVGYIELTELEE